MLLIGHGKHRRHRRISTFANPVSSNKKKVLRKTNRRINQLFLNPLTNSEALQIAHVKIAKIHFLPMMKWILLMVPFFHHVHTSSVQLIHPHHSKMWNSKSYNDSEWHLFLSPHCIIHNNSDPQNYLINRPMCSFIMFPMNK